MRHFACAILAIAVPAFCLGQDKPAPAPPNTKIEGMPPIPQAILEGVSKYGQFRAAELMAWHPTKRQIVINTSFNSTPAQPQLHLVDGPGRDRRQLTWLDRGVSSSAAVIFAPGVADSFVFQYDASAELRSLYRFNLTTGDVSPITEARSRYSPVFSRDGKWLAYDSAERNGRDRDLYVIQPGDPQTKRRLAEFTGAWSPQDWSPDGSSLLALELPSNGETYIWKIDVRTGQKTALTPRDGEKAGFYNARFSNDGRKVYALSDRVEDWRIWRCDPAKCAWTAVTPEGIGLDSPILDGGFELSPDGTLLATSAVKGATSELLLMDLTTLKPRTVSGVPQGRISRIQWRPGSREVGFSLGTVKSFWDVYSVDTSLGTVTRWTASETTFNAEALPVPEVVEWKSFDNETISGILYRPAAKFTGARPVIINIHGGPNARDVVRFQGRSNYILNELGAAIIYPNVRGSAGFGKRYERLDDGKLRVNAVKDIGALLDWIGTKPELDKTRVVLLGVSSGGWLALEAGAAYNDRIRGVIEGAGITNFVTFLENTDPARQDNRRAEYGDERDPAMRDFLTSLSPTQHAAQLKKPVFIIQPGKDARVPVAQAQELFNALKASNQNVWYLEFTEANHDNLPGVGGDYLLASWMWFFKNFLLN